MKVLCLFSTFLLALSPCVSVAWQEDMHYGLTKWLALKAGITEDQAELLANSNQDLDTNLIDAIEAVCRSACFGNVHRPTAQLVGKHHFPSKGNIPDPPQKRIVERGSSVVYDGIRDRLSKGGREQDLLSDLGYELHALQDSWSHAGVPDIPWFKCDPDYAWGHPKDRGGTNPGRTSATH